MDVSIIIVNFKTENLIIQSIESIKKETNGISYEIIIIDNASPNNSIKILEDYKIGKENIKIVKSNTNLGFGKACNIGFYNSQGEYLFFLNPDTILINNAIKILFDNLNENREYGAVGGNLYDEKKNPIHSFGREYFSLEKEMMKNNVFFKTKNQKSNDKDKKQRDDFNYEESKLEVAYICGADVMIPKEIFEECKGFNSMFFMYFEDEELQERINKKGYKIISVPEAKIIHLEGKSFEFKEKRYFLYTESKYKYINKKFGEEALEKLYKKTQLKNLYKIVTKFSNKYIKIFKINKKIFNNIKN